MNQTLLQIDFRCPGPWGDALTEACRELARDIAHEPGLAWKLWTENPTTGEAGGIYLFDDEAAVQRYLDKHLPRLAAFGVTEVRARRFRLNTALSGITRASRELLSLAA